MNARLRALAALTMLTACAFGAAAQTMQTSAPQAILLDFDSRSVLFEKDADAAIAPASLVKLMTAEVVFHEIVASRLKLDDEFVISENAWRRGGAPSGGSSMFAALGSRVRVEDLLRGLVIMSGNDAAIALAEGVAGTEEAFAQLMSKRAKEIGLSKSTFRNAWGKGDPGQMMTARELATLSAHIVRDYPQFYKYFGEKQFIWNKVSQFNRNPLLNMDIGADGLKTGNIEESGYSLSGSAEQNGQRLILVISGAKTAKERADESRKILLWGFRAFDSRLLFPAGEPIGQVKIYGGDKGAVDVIADQPVRVLFPRGNSERFSARIIYEGPLRAPIEKGAQVARLKVTRGSTVALDLPLRTAESVGVGSLPSRAFDAGWELGATKLRGLFEKTPAASP